MNVTKLAAMNAMPRDKSMAKFNDAELVAPLCAWKGTKKHFTEVFVVIFFNLSVSSTLKALGQFINVVLGKVCVTTYLTVMVYLVSPLELNDPCLKGELNI